MGTRHPVEGQQHKSYVSSQRIPDDFTGDRKASGAEYSL